MLKITDSVAITGDTQITPQGEPAYLRAWHLRSPETTYRMVEFKNGGSGGQVKWTARVAAWDNETVTEFALPGEGLLFPDGIYADVDGGAVTGHVMFTERILPET